MRASLLFVALLILLTGCSKDSATEIYALPEGCDSIAFSYSIHIKPVIETNCNLPACHATGGEGSYDFTIYAVIADRIRTGRFEDRLLLPIDDPQHMPHDINMNPCELYKLITWIQQSFPEN